MHLGWIVRKNGEIYETLAKKNGQFYGVILSPILESRERGIEKIYVGTIMKWFNGSWCIVGDELTGYHGVKGMHSGRYAAFHLLQDKGYMGWDRSC